jgi:hypothetical protein
MAVLAALALFLLLLAFFLGFGAHAVLGLIGVFVCHSVTPLSKRQPQSFSRNCRYTR